MYDYSEKTTQFIIDRIKNNATLAQENKQAALDMLAFVANNIDIAKTIEGSVDYKCIVL